MEIQRHADEFPVPLPPLSHGNVLLIICVAEFPLLLSSYISIDGIAVHFLRKIDSLNNSVPNDSLVIL